MSEPDSKAEERLAALSGRAANLPTEPGVYLMKGARGEVLYVGKAKSLRARVRTYFSGSGDGRAQITYLMRRVYNLDFVVTKTEKEAVILENNLIKKHRPRYNIIFRDDKTYLHVKLSLEDDWPRLYTVRRPKRDGSKYFGPYASAHSLYQTLEILQRVFPLRTCSDHELANRTRPCLEYEIGRCTAPCVGKISREKYAESVRQVELFLSGRREELIAQMEKEMLAASDDLQFEKAAQLRDRIAAIRETLEKQQVDVIEEIDRDVIALVDVGAEVWVQLLFVRRGMVVDTQGYALKRHLLELPEVLSQFLVQYYSDDRHPVPEEVIVPIELEDASVLSEWLSENRGSKSALQVPRRERRKELLEMAEKNAAEAVALKYEASQRQERVLRELQESLGLPRLPRRIECFDISHLQGGGCAASLVTFVNGEPEKNLYRKYELRGVPGGDDYKAMTQVLTRRYAKALPGADGEEVPEKDQLPDLIMVDGGKGQLGVLEEVLKVLGISGRSDAPARISLAKSRVLGPGSRTGDFGRSDERVFRPGESDPVVLKQDSPALLLLAYLRDESHRFALAYHRKLRAKEKFRSVLDDVPGVGPKRRIALLKHFGSVDAIRSAPWDALLAAPAMNRKTAAALWRFFRNEEPPAAIEEESQSA